MPRNKPLPDNVVMERFRRMQSMKRQREITKKAKEMGCENNLKLAEYIMYLEQRIEACE